MKAVKAVVAILFAALVGCGFPFDEASTDLASASTSAPTSAAVPAAPHHFISLKPTRSPRPSAPVLHETVVYVSGQSNAEYTGKDAAAASHLDGSDLLTFDGAVWRPARAELEGQGFLPQGGTGPLAASVTRGLGRGGVLRVIDRGKSGTKIALHLPGGDFYDQAIADWDNSGRVPSRVIWLQGESDGATSGADYAASLTTLVQAWRGKWGAALPVVIVEVPMSACAPIGFDNSHIRAAQEMVAKTEGCILVNDDDVAKNPTFRPDLFDGCHWTEPGYEFLGKRIADAAR